MSVSRNNKKKAKIKNKSAEEKSLRRKIRTGVLPKFHFVKESQGSSQLERKESTSRLPGGFKVKVNKLTWRQQGTLAILTKKEGV